MILPAGYMTWDFHEMRNDRESNRARFATRPELAIWTWAAARHRVQSIDSGALLTETRTTAAAPYRPSFARRPATASLAFWRTASTAAAPLSAAAPAACFATAATTLSRAPATYSANFATVGPPA